MHVFIDGPLADLSEAVPFERDGFTSSVLLKTGGGVATVFAFDAGAGLPEHVAPAEAVAVVVEGEVSFTMDGQTHRVAAGSAFRLPAGRPHTVLAAVPSRMLLVILREPS